MCEWSVSKVFLHFEDLQRRDTSRLIFWYLDANCRVSTFWYLDARYRVSTLRTNV